MNLKKLKMKSNKNIKKIFITGAAGFVGSHVVENLYTEYPKSKFILFDKVTYAANKKYIKNLLNKENVEFWRGDLINTSLLKKLLNKTDLAINIAAESHVDNSFGNSLQFTKTNTLGTHSFLESCRINNVKKIIHVSTDEVYGENPGKAFNEKQYLNPTNPYSASKAGADMIANSYIYSYKQPIIIVRANNIFGIRQYPEKLIPKTIIYFLKNKKMTIHGDGRYFRYFLSVEDFCNGLSLIIKFGNPGDIFNIASNNEYKITDVVKKIGKILKINIKNQIKYVKNRPFNDQSYNISCNKLKKLGWKTSRELYQELPEICRWYLENKILYKNI